MHSVPTIETERLILRPYRRDDFGPYSTLFADPEVTRFIGGVPFSREQAWTRFLRQVGMWHYFGFGFFALQDRETGQFIGEAGFHDLHRVITPSLEGTMETGWALSPRSHGRGLATEAVGAALKWGDQQFPSLKKTCIID
ncbi:MAG: GNAT family N-acetyltransferase, partial [Rhizobium giardinii]